MAWSAELKSKQLSGSQLFITVDFTDGIRVVSETFSFSSSDPDRLKIVCQQRIVSLESVDTAFTNLTPGPVDLTPIVKPADEIAKDAFFVNKDKLDALEIAIAKGLLKNDDANYLALVSTVKTAFLSAYTLDPHWK